MILTHRYIPAREQTIGFGAGWHSHLDALAAFVDGANSPERDAAYERLRPQYETRFR